ncbi:MAG: hypothetical protein Q8R28_10700 [Dehalococcoidia bacterium]|nr:hypothetical protein [Dehalococcoidia bacterium]
MSQQQGGGQAHTPEPWVADLDGPSIWAKRDGGAVKIADVFGGFSGSRDSSEAHANAHRVALAVNSFDDLVAALEKYGEHVYPCASKTMDYQPCDCGLDEILARATGEEVAS